MADDLHKLLRYIVDNLVLHDAAREAQIDATAVQDVPAEVQSITDDQRRDADRLAPYFAEGLRRVAQHDTPLVAVDNSDEGNGIADAFARYLVTSNLATSQSEPLPDGHFRYTFQINWPYLRQVAANAGVDLQQALRGQSGT